jgi:hypothetical protein
MPPPPASPLPQGVVPDDRLPLLVGGQRRGRRHGVPRQAGRRRRPSVRIVGGARSRLRRPARSRLTAVADVIARSRPRAAGGAAICSWYDPTISSKLSASASWMSEAPALMGVAGRHRRCCRHRRLRRCRRRRHRCHRRPSHRCRRHRHHRRHCRLCSRRCCPHRLCLRRRHRSRHHRCHHDCTAVRTLFFICYKD